MERPFSAWSSLLVEEIDGFVLVQSVLRRLCTNHQRLQEMPIGQCSAVSVLRAGQFMPKALPNGRPRRAGLAIREVSLMKILLLLLDLLLKRAKDVYMDGTPKCASRGGPSELDRISVFLSDISTGF